MTAPVIAPSDWTEERIETLKKLWLDGWSCSQIAALLGKGATRNSVIGKVHRLRLPVRRKRTEGKARIRVVRRPGKSGGGEYQRTVRARESSKKKQPPTALKTGPWQALLWSAPLGLLDLEPHHCRWPIGEGPFLFCGERREEGSPYCPTHRALGTTVIHNPQPSQEAPEKSGFSPRMGAQ